MKAKVCYQDHERPLGHQSSRGLQDRYPKTHLSPKLKYPRKLFREMLDTIRYNSLREMAETVIDIPSGNYRSVGVELNPAGGLHTVPAGQPLSDPPRVFVKRDLLESAMGYLRDIKKPFHLLTGSSDLDGCASPELAVWLRTNTNICSWTGTNLCEWFHWMLGVPIGLEERGRSGRAPEDFVKALKANSQDKDIDIYVPFFSPTHPSRADVIERLKKLGSARVVFENTRLPFPRYIEQIARSAFTVCPRGNGMDTVRAYEAICFESIPVVFPSPITPMHRRLGFMIVSEPEEIVKLPEIPFCSIISKEDISYSNIRALILKHQFRCYRVSHAQT